MCLCLTEGRTVYCQVIINLGAMNKIISFDEVRQLEICRLRFFLNSMSKESRILEATWSYCTVCYDMRSDLQL